MAERRRRNAVRTDDARTESVVAAGQIPVCGATRQGEGEFYGGIAGARRAFRDAKASGRNDEAMAVADFINALKREGLIDPASVPQPVGNIGFVRSKGPDLD